MHLIFRSYFSFGGGGKMPYRPSFYFVKGGHMKFDKENPIENFFFFFNGRRKWNFIKKIQLKISFYFLMGGKKNRNFHFFAVKCDVTIFFFHKNIFPPLQSTKLRTKSEKIFKSLKDIQQKLNTPVRPPVRPPVRTIKSNFLIGPTGVRKKILNNPR